MHLSELRQHLCQLPCIRDLPEALRQRVAMLFLGIGHEVTATDGQVLFREGEGDNDIAYVLLIGRVLIEKEETPEATAEAPDLLGELVKFAPIPLRSATVTVQGDAKLLKFAWAQFFSVAEKSLSLEEQAELRHALEEIAWGHFTA